MKGKKILFRKKAEKKGKKVLDTRG
jgi:hypothetical protein